MLNQQQNRQKASRRPLEPPRFQDSSETDRRYPQAGAAVIFCSDKDPCQMKADPGIPGPARGEVGLVLAPLQAEDGDPSLKARII